MHSYLRTCAPMNKTSMTNLYKVIVHGVPKGTDTFQSFIIKKNWITYEFFFSHHLKSVYQVPFS